MRRAFSLDLRSLGACRWALGLLTVADLVERRTSLRALYGPSGVFPTAVHTASRFRGFPSVFSLSESVPMLEAVWWLCLAFALAFAMGLHARWSALATFYLVTCLDERNTFITFGPHMVERVFLFWCVFLPCGARFSMVPTSPPKSLPNSIDPEISDIGATAFVAQLALVYACAAWAKLGAPSWLEGRGIVDAIRIDKTPGPLGVWLLGHLELCRIATFATLAAEMAMPFAVFVRRIRGPLVATFVLFHLALGLTLSLGRFPLTCCAVWLALAPSTFWDRVEKTSAGLADHRDRLLRLRAKLLPAARPDRPLGSLGRVVALVALVSVIAMNVADSMASAPRQLLWPARALGLSQSWGFYSGEYDGVSTWMTARAITIDGRVVDGWTLGPYDPSIEASAARPDLIENWLDNLELSPSDREGRRETTAHWMCREHLLSSVELVRMSAPAPAAQHTAESVVADRTVCP